ncbi:WD40 repeat-like protein [Microthyrium microscopicum]|uniref:Peroxin-7 n=1 Tax=Microthyrium microscopicum TaxID=703497 RepID=A0A6A6TZ56_9PEZI|nr:WD40 repeat-like protein [Microthyrium microscopicum]
MLEFRTKGYQGYSVKYSPFFDNRLATAASANFGLVGNGRLFILSLTPQGIIAEKWYDTKDALYDTTWSETHENHLLASCGDGSVRLYDLAHDAFPIAAWTEHAREVFSVHWNLVAKSTFLSCSWDGCIKIYDPSNNQSLLSLPTHSCTYAAQWSPHEPSLLAGVTSDSMVHVFDVRAPGGGRAVVKWGNHSAAGGMGMPPGTNVAPAEVLCMDWNKYRPGVLATAGVDRVIRTWDYRMPGRPLAILPGHEFAVRKVTWSPHLPDVLLSASYDMTCRIWEDGTRGGVDGRPVDPMAFGGGREVGRMGAHTEFATGVDWCLFGSEGWCASCAWDERVLVWDVRAFMRS